MDRFDRIFEVHRLLSGARGVVPRRRLDEALECSPATTKRILRNMRLYLNAPIEYDRERGGYYYQSASADGAMYELPGLWFNASELQALLVMRELLSGVQPGLLDAQLSPLADRIHRLLELTHQRDDDIAQRVRIIGIGTRDPAAHFQTLAGATMAGKRLQIEYHKRATGEIISRVVSPQRLVHYRDNWYVDAWCHLRDGLRSFAVEEIGQVKTLNQKAKKIPDRQLNQHFAAAYGIFAGPASHTAVLRFTNPRAQWVAKEQWHPEQQGRWLDDGRYELRVPYGDPTELVMDVLRHGASVEVVEPRELREVVEGELAEALARYSKGSE